MMIVKEPGIALPRPPPGGGGDVRVNHHRALRRMAPDIDAIVEGVAIDAVRAESIRNLDRLDQLHGLDVEHRGLRMVAGETVPGRRAHCRAVAANPGNTPTDASVSRSKIVSRFSKAGTAGLRGFKHLVRPVSSDLQGESRGREERDHDHEERSLVSHLKPPEVVGEQG